MIDHISVAAGDRDQRGSAPGDRAPWFANHSGDLPRARDAVQTRGSGGEVGSPGSGSENHSLHNAFFVSHPKQTPKKEAESKRRGGQGRLSGENIPRESICFTLDCHTTTLRRDFSKKTNGSALKSSFYLKAAFIFPQCNFMYFKDK